MIDIMSEYSNRLAEGMAKKLDDEIRAALDHHFGDWTMEDVKQRCRLVRVAGSDVETFAADSTPLLELHPFEFSPPTLDGKSYLIGCTRKYRRLWTERGR
jgi:hypothetical protein